MFRVSDGKLLGRRDAIVPAGGLTVMLMGPTPLIY
jgi:hypothetical protein